jgi:hypothetical protein
VGQQETNDLQPIRPKLTPVSKEQDTIGRISILASAEEMEGLRNYAVPDLKADDGLPEINDTIDKLPWKIIEKKPQRRPRHAR